MGTAGERGAQTLGVALSAAMYTLIGPDPGGRPLTPIITFADNRAVERATRLKEEMDGFAIHRRTGTPVRPISPLIEPSWFKERDPEIFGRLVRVSLGSAPSRW